VGKKRETIANRFEALEQSLTQQDERQAAALVILVDTLVVRHPQDINLALAKRGLADFCVSLAPGATPATPEEPRG
jgi:hypothetical protein